MKKRKQSQPIAPAQPKAPTAKTPCDPTDLLDEMDAAMRPTSAKMSEVENDWPEGLVTPDKETQGLIADVIAAADEFRPIHQKLKTVVDKHRTKIVLLKNKFGVRMGRRGDPVLVGKTAMFWDEFVQHYFGVQPHRLNQLLDVKDEKDTIRTIVKQPDEEKYLFRKGYEAGKHRAAASELRFVNAMAELRSLMTVIDSERENAPAHVVNYVGELDKRLAASDVNPPVPGKMAVKVVAPQPPPITGDPVPEPDAATLEELRQRIQRMADTNEIASAIKNFTEKLVAPLVAGHAYDLSYHVSLGIRRAGMKDVTTRDWVEQPKEKTLGYVVGEDKIGRPRVRWYVDGKWQEPRSLFNGGPGVRVLFDWQAVEKYPEAFAAWMEKLDVKSKTAAAGDEL